VSAAGNPKPKVAYGALYLDRGERMKLVKDQVKSLARDASGSPFFFDVIHGPDQEELAKEYAERVRRYVAKFDFSEISVSISFAATPDADPRHQPKAAD
jgi:hypothetical protein